MSKCLHSTGAVLNELASSALELLQAEQIDGAARRPV